MDKLRLGSLAGAFDEFPDTRRTAEGRRCLTVTVRRPPGNHSFKAATVSGSVVLEGGEHVQGRLGLLLDHLDGEYVANDSTGFLTQLRRKTCGY